MTATLCMDGRPEMSRLCAREIKMEVQHACQYALHGIDHVFADGKYVTFYFAAKWFPIPCAAGFYRDKTTQDSRRKAMCLLRRERRLKTLLQQHRTAVDE